MKHPVESVSIPTVETCPAEDRTEHLAGVRTGRSVWRVAGRVIPLLIAGVLLSACTEAPSSRNVSDPAAESTPPTNDEAVRAERAGDVQVVEIEVGTSGYSPERIALEGGVPARLVFTRTADVPCTEYVSIPEFGVERTELPLHEEQVIEIVPAEEGEFTFVCGMDMQEGTLIVAAS